MKEKVKKAFEFLEQFTNYERALRYPYDGWAMNLERVRAVLEEVGSPEKKLRVIHIAGTKGKGSTARMLQSILSRAGYKTGLFTSPHLISVKERITIDHQMISEPELAEVIWELKPGVEKLKNKKELGELTYFELITACAFTYFFKQQVDFAVMEVGLGGRYDATNVCQPALVIITTIGYDHTDILGSDLAQIAREKAMIIKPGVRVIMAPQPEPARQVIISRAEQVKAELYPLEDFYSWRLEKISPEKMEFVLEGKNRKLELETKMLGRHQMINAGLSVLASELLSQQGWKISESVLAEGLSEANLAGRFHQLEFAGKKLVLDGAHNPESAQSLVETLGLVYPEKKWNFIVGLSQDKNPEGFFAPLKPRAQRIVVCNTGISRSARFEKIAPVLEDFSGEVIFEPRLKKAFRILSRGGGDDDIIIITGSFYLVGEALKWLRESGIKIQIP